MRELCARAGVNLPAVRYHFGCKRDLYPETVGRAMQHPELLEYHCAVTRRRTALADRRLPQRPLGPVARAATRRHSEVSLAGDDPNGRNDDFSASSDRLAHGQRDLDGEDTALARDVSQRDLAAVGLDGLAADRQTQAHALAVCIPPLEG